MSLRKARVVAVHPSSGTCDLVFMDNGQRFTNVEVQGASSTDGCSWRTPNVPLPSSDASAAGVEGNMSNLVAYCGFVHGMPVILGFSRPSTGIAVQEQNRWLDAHDASGAYQTFAPDGSFEVYIPGGGYLRIGTGAHQNLAPLLSAGALNDAGPAAITVTLATANGTLTCDHTGAWKLTGAQLSIEQNVSITGSLTVSESVSIGTSLTVADDATIAGKVFLEHFHLDSGGSGDGGIVG
jgi:hypothetical protein